MKVISLFLSMASYTLHYYINEDSTVIVLNEKEWNTCNFCLYRIHLLREIPVSHGVSEWGRQTIRSSGKGSRAATTTTTRRLITIIAITKLALDGVCAAVLCPIESVRGLSCYYIHRLDSICSNFHYTVQLDILHRMQESLFCVFCKYNWVVVQLVDRYPCTDIYPQGYCTYFCRTNIQTFIPIPCVLNLANIISITVLRLNVELRSSVITTRTRESSIVVTQGHSLQC